MNTCDRLLRSRFNPCAGRVEAIGKFLDGVLEPAAEGELTSHLETCRRCREYQLFLEAADRGFREDKTIRAVLPELTRGLPARIQEEMAEALKRNLSRWLTDAGRALMYRYGLITPFFFDGYEGKTLKTSIERCGKLLNSLERFEAVSKDDVLNAQETRLLITNFRGTGSEKPESFATFFFERSCSFDRRNPVPYQYHAEIYMLRGEYRKAGDILEDGLGSAWSGEWKSNYLNNMGRIYLFMDDLGTAAGYFNRAKEEGGGAFNLLPDLNLAICGLRRKDAPTALQHFEAAVKSCEHIPSAGLRESGARYIGHMIAYHGSRHPDLTRDHSGFKALAERIGRILL